MEIALLSSNEIDKVVPLAAAFRVELRSYKGIASDPDLTQAREEIQEYLRMDYPVYVAMDGPSCVGYMVCRIAEPTVWVESIYVSEAYRRKGVATSLFDQAEAIAASFGEETVFNYVHPNNDAMIAFLGRHGYTVLNLIEIRKPYRGERLSSKIQVAGNPFDY